VRNILDFPGQFSPPDGCIPCDLGTGTAAEIEEERRLLHVAMMRARDELHLIVPQRFFTHGQNAYGDLYVCAARSRFIPDDLLDVFDRTTWPTAARELLDDARPPRQGIRLDVGARMRSLWR
jgi:DNA helicase II / ATP-dependent DNA helicase PcrA